VADAVVEATLPLLLPPVAAMVRLQLLSGMRPGEVCRMRPIDIDMTGKVWLYRPARHKTAWRGKPRVVALGPQAQAIVREFLPTGTEEPLFSPARAMEDRAARLRSARKSKVQPSQVSRKKAKPKRQPGQWYTTHSYAVAVRRACERASVQHWHPNQLRHTFATAVRRQHGLEAAKCSSGTAGPT
jgi:integrase